MFQFSVESLEKQNKKVHFFIFTLLKKQCEALWLKKMEISHASQILTIVRFWFFLSAGCLKEYAEYIGHFLLEFFY